MRHGGIPIDSHGAELTAHGAPDFPCGCYYCDPLAHEAPTIRQIADAGDVSVREAQRSFKAILGETP